MAGPSNPNHPGYPLLEKIIFGKRGLVLAVFTIITALMIFASSQLKIDAGFRKQLPIKHEYMQTFLDYEKEFGGTNRILIAVMAKNGDIFNKEYLTALEGEAAIQPSPTTHQPPMLLRYHLRCANRRLR